MLEYDKIVIGSSLNALMFAFNNRLPIFFSEAQVPFRFDFLDPKLDLSFLMLENKAKTLKTFGDDMVVGMPKELLWDRLMFLMSLRGQAPLADMCASMRYTGDSIVFSDEYSKIGEITFNYCYYFGDDNCKKLVQEEKIVDSETYICYDSIFFKLGGKHNIDFIKTNDKFVNTIWFYRSDRIDGNIGFKDAYTVSELTREQLDNFDYSEAMSNFKMIHEMKSRGMKGKKQIKTDGSHAHYNFRTLFDERRICRKARKAKSTSPTIEIAEENEDALYKGLSSASGSYRRFLDIPWPKYRKQD